MEMFAGEVAGTPDLGVARASRTIWGLLIDMKIRYTQAHFSQNRPRMFVFFLAFNKEGLLE